MRYALGASLLLHLLLAWSYFKASSPRLAFATPAVEVTPWRERVAGATRAPHVVVGRGGLAGALRAPPVQGSNGEAHKASNAEPPALLTAKDIARFGNELPSYPEEAERRGWQGDVILRLVLDPLGHVSQVSVEKSAGHEILDRCAERSARYWHFPVSQSGKAKDAPIIWRAILPFRLVD